MNKPTCISGEFGKGMSDFQLLRLKILYECRFCLHPEDFENVKKIVDSVFDIYD